MDMEKEKQKNIYLIIKNSNQHKTSLNYSKLHKTTLINTTKSKLIN